MKLIKKTIYIFALIVATTSCSEYQTLMKSNDYNLKYQKAKDYYYNGDYAKAQALLEDVVPIFKGTSYAEEALYIQAMAAFRQKDYMYAEHYFSVIVKTYPHHEHIMECYFNRAFCSYMQSPNEQLDQSSTSNAIQAFSLFIDLYPNTEEAKEAQQYVDELTEKLAHKEYLSAKLYFDLGDYMGNNYKAAIATAENCLRDYPSTQYREDLAFIILDSRFLMAERSIEEKQMNRYRAVIDEYYSFLNDYPDSKYKDEADNIFNKAQKKLK